MALCFGAGLTTRELVGERFCGAVRELLEPLLTCHSAEKVGGPRR
ncbi:MAG: hypothetical protein ACKO7Z_01865 [Cyanobacteriota bacterium]